jgi:hypothetical protein
MSNSNLCSADLYYNRTSKCLPGNLLYFAANPDPKGFHLPSHMVTAADLLHFSFCAAPHPYKIRLLHWFLFLSVFAHFLQYP